MSFTNLFTPGTITSITTGVTAFTALTFSLGAQVRLKNQDTTNLIFFKFGNTGDTVTTTTGVCLGPGDVAGFTAPAGVTGIVTVSSAGAPVLNITQGYGT